MVIIVEEEKINSISLPKIISWAIFLVIVAVSTYYVFFEKPTIIEGVVPTNFPGVQDVERYKRVFDASTLRNNPLIQSKNYVPLPTGLSFGRENPFIPPISL